jgi:hypothetical protein
MLPKNTTLLLLSLLFFASYFSRVNSSVICGFKGAETSQSSQSVGFKGEETSQSSQSVGFKGEETSQKLEIRGKIKRNLVSNPDQILLL